MKHYDNSRYTHEKYRTQTQKREHDRGGFRCSHCKQFVVINSLMGTAHRNHCNWCLWSKHVDNAKGDRRARCDGGMEPIGLTFKHAGYNRIGEVMLIHLCSSCQKISINRIARDDPESQILAVFASSLSLSDITRHRLLRHSIDSLTDADSRTLSRQLFGKDDGT